jgi:hypothetical protein
MASVDLGSVKRLVEHLKRQPGDLARPELKYAAMCGGEGCHIGVCCD